MNSIRIITAVLLYLSAAPTLAAPVFWLSDSSEPGTPGLLDLSVEPNSTGQLHIWANADVRLSAVSLDLIAMGGSIKFTGAEIHNPRHCDICNPRWLLTSTPHVTADSVSNIHAAVLARHRAQWHWPRLSTRLGGRFRNSRVPSYSARCIISRFASRR